MQLKPKHIRRVKFGDIELLKFGFIDTNDLMISNFCSIKLKGIGSVYEITFEETEFSSGFNPIWNAETGWIVLPLDAEIYSAIQIVKERYYKNNEIINNISAYAVGSPEWIILMKRSGLFREARHGWVNCT